MLKDAIENDFRWISCNDRLPEVGVPVLTFDGQDIYVERHIRWIDTEDGKLKGDWWVDGIKGDNYNCVGLRDSAATHWMPLAKRTTEELLSIQIFWTRINEMNKSCLHSL